MSPSRCPSPEKIVARDAPDKLPTVLRLSVTKPLPERFQVWGVRGEPDLSSRGGSAVVGLAAALTYPLLYPLSRLTLHTVPSDA